MIDSGMMVRGGGSVFAIGGMPGGSEYRDNHMERRGCVGGAVWGKG